MTKKDFIIIADVLADFLNNPTIKEKLTSEDKKFLVDLFAVRLQQENYRFDGQRFWQRVLGVKTLVEAVK